MESGKRIADLLQAKNGGNQSELARFVGVSPQAVQQWVAGETSPRGKNLNKVAEFFGIPPAQVLYGTSGGGATMRPRAEMEVAGLLQQAGWEVEVIGKDSADNLPAAFSGEGYRYIPDMRIRKAGRELHVVAYGQTNPLHHRGNGASHAANLIPRSFRDSPPACGLFHVIAHSM